MLKLTLSTLLTGLIVYLVYLEISENPLPNALHDVMQNEYSRMALLVSIPLAGLVDKNLAIPMMLAVIYLLMNNLTQRDVHVEKFLTTFFGKNTFDHTPLADYAGAGGVNDFPKMPVEQFTNNTILTALE